MRTYCPNHLWHHGSAAVQPTPDVKLNQHDLQQLDDDALRRLPEEALRTLSLTLLSDLKEARERLQQPTNSSRPPSSRAPWERGQPAVVATPADAVATDAERASAADAQTTSGGPAAGATDAGAGGGMGARPKRRPGKQPGASGVGRSQVFEAHATEIHRPAVCAVCGRALAGDAPRAAYTAFQSLDLQWGDPAAPGLHLWVVDHQYLAVTCSCGHHTLAGCRCANGVWSGRGWPP